MYQYSIKYIQLDCLFFTTVGTGVCVCLEYSVYNIPVLMVKMGVLMSSTCRGCLQLTSLSMIDLVSSSPSQVTRELFQNSVDVFTEESFLFMSV